MHAQLAIAHRPRGLRPLLPRVGAARGDTERPTTLRHGELGPLRGNPGELYCFPLWSSIFKRYLLRRRAARKAARCAMVSGGLD